MEIDPSPRSSLIGFVEGTQLDATAITFVDLAPSLSLSLSPSLPSFLSQSLYQSQELPPTRYSYRLNGFLSLYLSLSPSLSRLHVVVVTAGLLRGSNVDDDLSSVGKRKR